MMTSASTEHFVVSSTDTGHVLKQDRCAQSVVCICPAWGKRDEQIATKNYKRERDRITKKKLAHYIAKRIEVYLKELEVSGQGNQCALY